LKTADRIAVQAESCTSAIFLSLTIDCYFYFVVVVAATMAADTWLLLGLVSQGFELTQKKSSFTYICRVAFYNNHDLNDFDT